MTRKLHEPDVTARTAVRYGYLWDRSCRASSLDGARPHHFDRMRQALSLPPLRGLVLDAGCGEGLDLANQARRPGLEIIGVELSKGGCQASAARTRGLSAASVVQGDLRRLPFADGLFDFIYSYGVLHHLPAPEAGLAELVRVLKPGSRIALYLYEDFRERPLLWRGLLAAATPCRRLTTRMPPALLYRCCQVGSPMVYALFTVPHRLFRAIPGCRSLAAGMPFRHGTGPFSLVGDLYDRFSAPIERRYTRQAARALLEQAGLGDLQIVNDRGWIVAGTKPASREEAARSAQAERRAPADRQAEAPAAGALAGKEILCLSSIDWDFIWQGHQEIMTTLAKQGHRVLFIENTGVRAPRLRDLPRLTHRLLNWLRSTKGFREERERLFVYSPLILPFPYSPAARGVNRWLLLRALQRWMRAAGFQRPILWTFLPTPLALDLIRELDPELTVYYCIDDLASSSTAAKRISRSEAQLFRAADLVFVTSEKLRERAARLNDQVHVFPFGVDFEAFTEVRLRVEEPPADLRGIPRPVVGYVGGLHRWVDQELLAEVAGRLPQATFLLIGPAQTDLSRLLRCPNVRWLGARPHDELPRYAKSFDVGIVPYSLSEYTAHVYPTKLNEYLAMGIPVIATALPEVQRFNARHGEVVAVARDAGEFARAIRDALTGNSPELIGRRIEASRQNSWSARIAQMSALIAQRLASRQADGERWQESLRSLYRTARRRLVRVVAVGGMAYALLFQSPLLWLVAEPLRVTAPPAHAEVIVVFAGGVGESGKAGGGYQERVKQAVDLYRQGSAPRIIFSSGYTFVFPEAEVMRELAVAHGVPASAIILEQRAATTYENVARAAEILTAHGWRSALLVSSPYHMRRALLAWRKAAPQIRVSPAPVADSRFYAHTRGATLEQIRGILHEYVGIVYYWAKGWI